MGWTVYNKSMTEAEALEELRRLHSWTAGDGTAYRVKADGVTGGGDRMGYYAAVEIRERGKPVRDFCAVCLITLRPFGYKDMSESMGPYIWSAPLEVLQALSPLPSPPVVTEWRDCRYCEGTGHMAAPNQRHECIWCDGSGKQPVHDHERDRHAGARKWRAEAWARHGVQASAA